MSYVNPKLEGFISRIENWIKDPRCASAWMFFWAAAESFRCLVLFLNGLPVEANAGNTLVLIVHSLVVLIGPNNCLIISPASLRRLDPVVLAWVMPVFLASLGRVV